MGGRCRSERWPCASSVVRTCTAPASSSLCSSGESDAFRPTSEENQPAASRMPRVRSDDRLRTHTMVGQGGRTGGVRVSVPADSLISRETKPTSPPAVKSSLLDASHRSPTHTREPSAPPLPQRRAFTPLAGAVRSPARRLVLAVEGRVAHARRHPLPIHQGLPQHAAAPLATSLVKMAAVAIAATVVQSYSGTELRRRSSVVCCRIRTRARRATRVAPRGHEPSAIRTRSQKLLARGRLYHRGRSC